VAGVISVPLVVGDVLAGGWERPVEHQDAPETPVSDAFCNVDALDESWPCRIDDLPRLACEVLTALRKINAH
jgi:hypothetical protein